MQQNQIQELVHFLNPNRVQFRKHQDALYELDTRLFILNKTLVSAMQAVSYLGYTVAVVTNVLTYQNMSKYYDTVYGLNFNWKPSLRKRQLYHQ